ncbi:MAG: mannitol-/sugar-/sorbitol-6-/2-deoxyglucose-6-phosphatase [Thermomicrobiales bacterium]|nr:mannitol-/sugar-/sorbitol-6-/2-deoxyglucose-6-phosphatase [Thermomicrobiales bacterium]
MPNIADSTTIPCMIRAVIFDMDGLLIDSEPLWRIAEIEVFTAIGVPLTEELALTTMGLRTDEVVEHWFARCPWQGPTHKEVEARIDSRVIELVRERAAPLPGVHAVVSLLTVLGLPLAIASSSSSELIAAVVEQIGLRDSFQVLQSAEHEPYGKPHPGVYIAAARALGIAPTDCLAFEDSANGVLAAKAARMRCIAVPEPAVRDDRRFCIADAILTSLTEFHPEQLNQF